MYLSSIARSRLLGPCMCGALDCRSCGPAQGVDPDEDTIKLISESKFARLAAADWQSEAEAVIDDAEERGDTALIEAAARAAVTGPLAVRMLLEPQIRERLEARCRAEAVKEIEQMRQEAEAEAAMRRMEH